MAATDRTWEPEGDPYPLHRPNVGLALFNSEGQVFLGQRADERHAHAWQMPQGGIDPGERAADAALRELAEETGVAPALVEPLGALPDWVVYDFPPHVLAAKRAKGRPWIGQKQLWFAFRFLGCDTDVDLNAQQPPEFDAWRWERLARTPELVIPWKREVYQEVAAAFAVYAAN